MVASSKNTGGSTSEDTVSVHLVSGSRPPKGDVRADRIPTRMLALDRYEYCTRMHACSRPRRWAGGDRLVRMYLSCYKVAAPRPLPIEIDRAQAARPLHDSSSCKRFLGPERAQDSAERCMRGGGVAASTRRPSRGQRRGRTHALLTDAQRASPSSRPAYCRRARVFLT